MDTAKAHWNSLHTHYTREEIAYDNWLEDFLPVIRTCTTPIIDLGCGSGNDTKYLLEQGKQVIACDYAPNAVENIRRNFPEITDARCFDMTEGLPFPNGYTELIIADLSLHYFSAEITHAVLNEIKRVLKPNGILLFRVNSVKDFNHGAGQGTEVERNFFKTADGRFKRFFDMEDISKFFGHWKILSLCEREMTRYALPKMLWTGMCQADQ